jgi:hypothetical protein
MKISIYIDFIKEVILFLVMLAGKKFLSVKLIKIVGYLADAFFDQRINKVFICKLKIIFSEKYKSFASKL